MARWHNNSGYTNNNYGYTNNNSGYTNNNITTMYFYYYFFKEPKINLSFTNLFLVHVELRGGDGVRTGNVFAVNNQGYFGPICDDYWFNEEATVVCRQLGFNSGVAKVESFFGLVPNRFAMDDINCAGDEDTIQQCSYEIFDDCSYAEGAGVECS